MATLDPRSPGFRNIKSLINRLLPNDDEDIDCPVSVEDRDVPTWQRQVVWTPEEMGLLAYSIIRKYPIGMVILWNKPDGIRVPIDGRQRLTAIREFHAGRIALPKLPSVSSELQNCKFKLHPHDEENGFKLLGLKHREAFEDYELSISEYTNIDEETAMDIFVMLQGGKSLSKTEVRAALGGKLCDFVSELTISPAVTEEDEDEAESRHAFFKGLAKNVPNRRKAHRNVADVLLHEMLYPGQDKHWSSLERMYREKARHLSVAEKTKCRNIFGKFHKAVLTRVAHKKVILPQLRSAFLILTVFKCWRELRKRYDLPSTFVFSDAIARFERLRVEAEDEMPWVNFTSALSNAGYAQGRIQERHEILMSWILREYPRIELQARDGKRAFSLEQKIAIWERAGRRCEHIDDDEDRCKESFAHPRKFDADHIVRWKDNGPTTVENGRLLCPKHNRGRSH